MKQLLILLSIIVFSACEKCDCGSFTDNSIQPPAPKDEYYIKYSCSTGGYPHTTVSMAYTDATGETVTKSGRIVKGLSQTIGPVGYGFHAKVSASVSIITIQCSKNNGPFMVKNSTTDGGGLSYTIDF